jgi:hypothetical protein
MYLRHEKTGLIHKIEENPSTYIISTIFYAPFMNHEFYTGGELLKLLKGLDDGFKMIRRESGKRVYIKDYTVKMANNDIMLCKWCKK